VTGLREFLRRQAAALSVEGRGPALRGRYGLLLLLLIATYLLSAFSHAGLAEPLQVALFSAVLVLSLRNSPLERRQVRLLGWATVIGSVAALAAALTGTDTGYGLGELWKGLILLLSAVFIVRRVLARPTVTLQSIYGALSAYLIVGLMFAAFYAAMNYLGLRPFFASGQPAQPQTFQYFSFTTLTTLGYGDFVSVQSGGRAVAVIEALAGQVFLATLVARLVAAFRGSAGQARPAATGQARPAASGRRPPRALRRTPAMSHRGRPARKTVKISSGSRPGPADRRHAVDSRASGPEP
jgi:Ion channel